jgi:SAM-dependent methyltransferase
MLPKPKHLAPEYAAIFKDRGVAEAYRYRPPYPAETIETLAGLATDLPRAVLDVGSGTGDIARPLSGMVDRLDAVDFSLAMIEAGKRLPGGDAPNLVWIHSSVEEASFSPPYALVTAGESVHWMAWDVVFPRFAAVLSPNGAVAIVERNWDRSEAVRQRMGPIIQRYATNRDYQPYDIVSELEIRGLFATQGTQVSTPYVWEPTIAEYIECRHSQNGLSRERMGESSMAFDSEVRDALQELCREGALDLRNGRLELDVEARVTWGRPVPDSSGV